MADWEEKKIGDVTVRIERTVCIGSGSCVDVAPEVFELDDRQIVTFKDKPSADSDTLTTACQVCPVEALVATDAQGKRLAP